MENLNTFEKIVFALAFFGLILFVGMYKVDSNKHADKTAMKYKIVSYDN